MISARKGITPVIAIVLLLMMTVAAAGMAYVWVTGIQQDTQNKVSQNMQTKVNQMAGSVGIDAVYENWTTGYGATPDVTILVRNTGSVTFTQAADVYVGSKKCSSVSVNNPTSTGSAVCSVTNLTQEQIIRVIPPQGTAMSIYCDCRTKDASNNCETNKLDNYCAI